jgi:hypothetical protein
MMWCLNRFGRLDDSHFTPLPGASKDLEVILGTAWWKLDGRAGSPRGLTARAHREVFRRFARLAELL